MFFIAGAKFSHRLFSAGSFHLGVGGGIFHMGHFNLHIMGFFMDPVVHSADPKRTSASGIPK